MAVAAAVAAAVATAGLRGRRFKRAPQTRRTSPDQPPSPTPPPAAFLSAPSVPPAAPNPGYPAAAWAGSDPAPYSLRQQVRPGSEAGLLARGQTRRTRAQPGVKLALSFPAPRGSQSAPHLPSHSMPLQGNLSSAGTGQGQGYLNPADLSARSSAGTDAQLAFIYSGNSDD